MSGLNNAFDASPTETSVYHSVLEFDVECGYVENGSRSRF